ncbi:MAG: hypothetical protein KBC64_05570 [Simkaniaceae bacterium]|nr:hypothetical protein [Simkaniaceae bacterium]
MSIVPIVLFIASFICAFINSHYVHSSFTYELIRYLLLLSVGVQGIWAFIGHFFYSADVAKFFGWKSGPFQQEVSFALLSYGVLGVMSYFFESVWLGAILAITVFLFGAAYTHATDMIKRKNFSMGNAGPIFYLDLLIPITLWIAVFIYFV